jgi:hypothetical protein
MTVTGTWVSKLTFRSVALIVMLLFSTPRKMLDRMDIEFLEEIISWAMDISFSKTLRSQVNFMAFSSLS